MTSRPFPSYRLFKDNRGKWRWRYDAAEGDTIAVSCDGYDGREDCERAIDLLKSSLQAPLWISRLDIAVP